MKPQLATEQLAYRLCGGEDGWEDLARAFQRAWITHNAPCEQPTVQAGTDGFCTKRKGHDGGCVEVLPR